MCGSRGSRENGGGSQIIYIIKNEVGLSTLLQANGIVHCHRVGRTLSEPGRPRPELVKFQCELHIASVRRPQEVRHYDIIFLY